MIPPRISANGVPWVQWMADGAWICEGCRRTGHLPAFTGVAPFAKVLGDIKREHAGCGEEIVLDGLLVGHPLNPDRAER